MNDPRTIAICGTKNSGKTTLITRLLPVLTGKGYKVAVIKHDGHDFACDVPGTDSYRFTENGAYGVAVFSPHRMFIHKTCEGANEKALISMFPEADILLIEGLKDSSYPKIEVISQDISDTPVSNPEGRFLIATDINGGDAAELFNEETVSIDNIEEIAARMLSVL